MCQPCLLASSSDEPQEMYSNSSTDCSEETKQARWHCDLQAGGTRTRNPQPLDGGAQVPPNGFA